MGFNLVRYREELRKDLKDDTAALWADEELNRCVQRAVDDLSRFLPLELVYEVTFIPAVTGEGFTTPATALATAIVNAQTLNGKSGGDVLTVVDYTPDVPRRLTVTLTDADASVTALTITIKGYDQNGYYAEESWYLKDLVTTVARQGEVYFKRIVTVEVTNISGAVVAGDTISVGTGNAYDSYVFLVNKPIKPESETVTSSPAGTTYARDTDYRMDYYNGGIKFINGGGMAAGTAYLIGYTKSKLGIDINSILPAITRIQRVEYPIDQIPQQFVSYNIFGNFLYIGSKMTGKSQEEMVSGEHIAIHYERKHQPPGEDSPGSYQDVLDEVICIGANAYALFMKSLQYVHQAITDIGYVDTALDKITTEMAAVDAELVLAGAVWTDEVKHILTTAGIPGMESYLELGAPYIPTINVAADVSERYRTYAETAYLMVRAWEQKRADFLTEASRYLDKADAWIGEAVNRIGNAGQYLEIANRLRTEAIEKRNEFWSILKDKAEYRKRTSSTPLKQPA